MESQDYWFVFLCLLLAFVLTLFWVMGIYENQGISSLMDSLLVGILVIVTGYYAFTVRKQTMIMQKEYERTIWKEFSEIALSGWKEQLERNMTFFQKDCFMYSQAEASVRQEGWLERKLLQKFARLENTRTVRDFYEKNAEIGKKIDEYKLEVRRFVEQYCRCMDKLLAVIKRENLLRRVSRNWHPFNTVFPWIVKKQLMSEEQFNNEERMCEFIDYIWNSNKDELEERLKPLEEEGKRIGNECLRLAEFSRQLLEILI